MLNYIAVDLQLYKIFKIMRVSFFLGHIGSFIFVLAFRSAELLRALTGLEG